ncbi:tRNA (guanosine(37)-N1)-methyltransferase TrmD [Pseudonocardia xishanensis]|uniref:tRNA (guanosine(37)-N1)-methyltransferase TrmD n=1 Tax=Pseudonocardia xishanensis TaxID=630995 RepID=UPI0031EFA19E
MRIDVVTIFPGYLAPLREALLGRAIEKGLIDVAVHDLRAWTHDVHGAVDDSPYGGGPGMVMKPQVWGEALDGVIGDSQARLVVPTPAGRPFTQATAHDWAGEERLVFACGRYEGIDQRVVDHYAQRMPVDEVSIGDYVLVGGEVAVLVMVEAVVRLLPGVLGNPRSAAEDSFSDGLLEGPSYTRPEVWRDLPVPPVLRSGDHAAVDRWRRDRALERTAARRPDLLAALPPSSLDAADRAVLDALDEGSGNRSGTMDELPRAGRARRRPPSARTGAPARELAVDDQDEDGPER